MRQYNRSNIYLLSRKGLMIAGKSDLMKYYSRSVILIVTILISIISLIQLQHYENRGVHGLLHENCPSPCFMGIRPGWTNMQDAYYLLAAHSWVANSADEFPSLLRESSLIGASIPRTIVRWRWSTLHPEWINGAVQGTITLQDRDVLNMAIETQLSLGEIILALGLPDEAHFMALGTASDQRFGYTAWYADEGLLIQTEGVCPIRHRYELPVRILFSSQALPEAAPMTALC